MSSNWKKGFTCCSCFLKCFPAFPSHTPVLQKFWLKSVCFLLSSLRLSYCSWKWIQECWMFMLLTHEFKIPWHVRLRWFFSQFIQHLFIYGCAGSSLLHAGFLELWQVEAPLESWCVGFSLQWLSCGVWALGMRALVNVAHRLSCCSSGA